MTDHKISYGRFFIAVFLLGLGLTVEHEGRRIAAAIEASACRVSAP